MQRGKQWAVRRRSSEIGRKVDFSNGNHNPKENSGLQRLLNYLVCLEVGLDTKIEH